MKSWAGRYRSVTHHNILSDFNNPVNINKSKGSKIAKKMTEQKLLDMQLHEIIQDGKGSRI